jgi:uncharacterized membrane protein
MNKKVIIGISILILVIVIFFIARPGPTGGVINEGDVVSIPLSEISSKAVFYDYEGIEYFAVEADDGTIRTAFNACDVCYKSRKGYRQEGGDMICNNCGNHYPISGLGTKNLRGGGCWPGYLPSSVEGDQLIIQKSDLEAGKYRF